ncbi:MAG TPA: hypothetical protein VMI06_19685 [Terriglobia bacterium]|nr:hypothetical protein [Terriglobia bacterium]
MQEKPDHHDAELLLKLYELRREEKLRRAREWFVQHFQSEPTEELVQRYPPGSEENAFFRMAVGYWEMAASLLNHGLIHEDLFFENTMEMLVVWSKLKPAAASVRERSKNPRAWKNLEDAAGRYEKWLEKRAPGALAVALERMQLFSAKKH